MSEAAQAPRTSALRRVLPILAALALALVWTRFYAPRAVDLVMVLPPEMPAGGAFDLRVTRSDGAEVRRARRELPEGSHSLVLSGKLPRGTFRVDAWSARPDGAPALEGAFSFDGEDVLEVSLHVRAP